MNLFRVGEMGVGKTGQIIGETRVGEMGVGKTGVILCGILCKSPVWHADGAFVNRFMHFFQLYTLHGIVLGQLLPLLHCLLTKQQFAVYFTERHGGRKGSRHFLFICRRNFRRNLDSFR